MAHVTDAGVKVVRHPLGAEYAAAPAFPTTLQAQSARHPFAVLHPDAEARSTLVKLDGQHVELSAGQAQDLRQGRGLTTAVTTTTAAFASGTTTTAYTTSATTTTAAFGTDFGVESAGVSQAPLVKRIHLDGHVTTSGAAEASAAVRHSSVPLMTTHELAGTPAPDVAGHEGLTLLPEGVTVAPVRINQAAHYPIERRVTASDGTVYLPRDCCTPGTQAVAPVAPALPVQRSVSTVPECCAPARAYVPPPPPPPRPVAPVQYRECAPVRCNPCVPVQRSVAQYRGCTPVRSYNPCIPLQSSVATTQYRECAPVRSCNPCVPLQRPACVPVPAPTRRRVVGTPRITYRRVPTEACCTPVPASGVYRTLQ
eukprot:EG_transcript_15247